MTTLGGILVEEGHATHFDKCGFSSLSFTVKEPENKYRIEVPALTNRELRFLDRQLPDESIGALSAQGVPERDIKRYKKVYRYFPAFAEADF